MLTLNLVISELMEHILARHIHVTDVPCTHLRILGDAPLDSGTTLYVGTAEAALAALALPDRHLATLITAGSHPGLAAYTDRENLNLIVTDLPAVSLYNRLFDIETKYREFEVALNRAVYKGRDLQQLLDVGGAFLGGKVYLLNSGYRVMAYCGAGDFATPYAQELEENGYQPYTTVQEITKEGRILKSDTYNREATWMELALPRTEHVLFTYYIKYQGNIVARLTIFSPRRESCAAFRDLALCLSEYVETYLLTYHLDKYQDNTEFDTLVSDLIDYRIHSPAELESRLSQMTINIRKYYHCIVIEFEHTQGPPHQHQLRAELNRIFPYSNTALYNGDLVVLVRKLQHYLPLEYEAQGFQELLELHNAYASVGNYSKWLTSLHSIYLQTKSIIKYAKLFCPQKGNRIFRYEEYSMYQIIELCADKSHFNFHHDNLLYLCHPGILGLLKYDQKYGSNLREVLTRYLLNNRNATLTAKELQLHRNTLLYKMNKIEEIVGEPLEDSLFQHRLLFSSMVVDYILTYRKEDPFALKG